MDARQYAPSFMRADDLTEQETKAVIKDVVTTQIEDKDRLVVEFDGDHNDLLLNTTNCRALMKLFGNETGDWKGKEITLYKAKVSFQGKEVDGVRVKGGDS